MSSEYSADELQSFLQWGVEKGLLKQETGNSRRTAVQKVLSALDESEREDLRGINIDSTFARFVNKNAKSFTPQSLATYKSRFQTALEDFLRYKEDPTTFRFEGQRRARSSPPALKEDPKSASRRNTRAAPIPDKNEHLPPPPPQVTEVVFPIPIREGVIVRVHNIPNNLTKAEAQRISAVILALAMG